MRTLGRRGTKIHRTKESTSVQYHQTTIIWFDIDKIILNSGGWRTATTKRRMNQTSQQFDLGFYVYQKNFEWFAHIESTGERFSFYDGIEIKRYFD